MNRAIISQRITSILAEIERLNNALYAMNTTDIQRYPDNYEVLSTDAALRAERITCRLRHLIYATTSIKKEEYLRSAETMQGIEISENAGILEIKLPCLLPKRRQRQSTEFLLDPFTSALSDYAAHHTMPQFQHCVVCFSHIYAQELPERRSKTTETKVIGNLDRNDMSYVPATTVKNGKTLSLANVEWQVTGTALVGEALVPAQYQAVATYSASNSYQAATGYVTTAEYHGTVTSEGVDSITYTVVYTGSEIVPVKTHIWDNGSLAAPLLIIAAVLLCAGIAAAALILLRRRKNVYVYVPDSKPREYRLIAKFRVEPDSEVPTIDAGALTLNPGDTVAVEVKKSLARHLAGREFTVSFPQSNHTYTIQASKHNDWHEFTVPAEEEQEAPV